MEMPQDVGTKVHPNGFGHMTKMLPRPYMVRTFKSLLLQDQKANDLGTWYVALGMWGLLIDFSLSVKAVTLIFISGSCSASSSAKQEKSGSIYNLVKN